MKTVKDVFATYKTGLQNLYDIHETEAITLNVMQHITGRSSAAIKAFTDDLLLPEAENKANAILTRLITGEPLQYIIGQTEFYGLPFNVNPAVLIPRPETEELVEWVLNAINQLPQPAMLDIGTGSGCIAISLKVNKPGAQMAAVDISVEALKTAEVNAALNGAEVNFINADILIANKLPGVQALDVVISNPPYVTPHDQLHMHKNVTDFEPHTALFVPQDDPLLFYNAIANFAQMNLKNGGWLFFEINEGYGPQTIDMLVQKGFVNAELRKDMSGRDRMTKAQWLP